jgi:hypothetical protein
MNFKFFLASLLISGTTTFADNCEPFIQKTTAIQVLTSSILPNNAVTYYQTPHYITYFAPAPCFFANLPTNTVAKEEPTTTATNTITACNNLNGLAKRNCFEQTTLTTKTV